MSCNICGTTDSRYRRGSLQTLCDHCSRDTPNKASRLVFERCYWGAGLDSVPRSVRREFYADYLASTCTLQEYRQSTTEVMD
jgi:hypothetical protein